MKIVLGLQPATGKGVGGDGKRQMMMCDVGTLGTPLMSGRGVNELPNE